MQLFFPDVIFLRVSNYKKPFQCLGNLAVWPSDINHSFQCEDNQSLGVRQSWMVIFWQKIFHAHQYNIDTTKYGIAIYGIIEPNWYFPSWKKTPITHINSMLLLFIKFWEQKLAQTSSKQTFLSSFNSIKLKMWPLESIQGNSDAFSPVPTIFSKFFFLWVAEPHCSISQ